jgi:hypothetical protein
LQKKRLDFFTAFEFLVPTVSISYDGVQFSTKLNKKDPAVAGPEVALPVRNRNIIFWNRARRKPSIYVFP